MVVISTADGGVITRRPFSPRNLHVMQAYARELASMGLFGGGIFVRVV